MTAPARRKVSRKAPQLSPEQARRGADQRAFMAKMSARRYAHPRREMLLDLLVGVPMTIGAIVTFLAYLGILRF